MSDSHKEFKEAVLDTFSSSFCAAKWLTVDFWLHTGTTSSCHLPGPDHIDLNEVEHDISLFNNTKQKLAQKQMMLDGERPDKCSNCWYIEDSGSNTISQRIMYSKLYYEQQPYTVDQFTNDTKPVKIRVAFDTLCNFTCSYCDPSQSTSWLGDVKVHGIYKNIKGDPRYTYQRAGVKDLVDNYDDVYNKFCEYVEYCKDTLTSISTLGGEPLMSPYFWKFVEYLTTIDFKNKVVLDVTTNLSNKKLIERLLNTVDDRFILKFTVSIEAIGKQAEFIRYGLEWDTFVDNLNYIVNNTNSEVVLISTVNNLATDGLVKFLTWYHQLTTQHNNQIRIMMYMVRHPSFQSIQALPQQLKDKYAKELDFWIKTHIISEELTHYLNGISSILKQELDKFENVDIGILQESAKAFYQEYAKRRNLDITTTFSEDFANWINT
jgi:organic radical activating enzyme